MAINFPNSPTNGQLYLDSNTGNLYKYLSSKGAWTSFANNISTTVSASAPASPLNGTLWWNSNLGKLFIYYTDGDSNQWVEATIGSTTVDAGLLNSYVGPAFATANNAANNVTLSYNQANAAYTAANNVNLGPAFNQANAAYTAANVAASSGGVSPFLLMGA